MLQKLCNHHQLEVTKSSTGNALKISGYASVFNSVDNHNDILVPGAFAESLTQHNHSQKIKLLWQHEHNKPIGVITRLKEDNYGLWMEANLIGSTQPSQEAIELVKQQAINGLSIGFNILKSHFDQGGRRVITNLDLWEISLVTFPANNASCILTHNAEAQKSLQLILNLAMLNLTNLSRRSACL